MGVRLLDGGGTAGATRSRSSFSRDNICFRTDNRRWLVQALPFPLTIDAPERCRWCWTAGERTITCARNPVGSSPPSAPTSFRRADVDGWTGRDRPLAGAPIGPERVSRDRLLWANGSKRHRFGADGSTHAPPRHTLRSTASNRAVAWWD